MAKIWNSYKTAKCTTDKSEKAKMQPCYIE